MLKKEINAIISTELGLYTMAKDVIVGFDASEAGDVMTIRIGDELLIFRYEEVAELIRQERMRNG